MFRKILAVALFALLVAGVLVVIDQDPTCEMNVAAGPLAEPTGDVAWGLASMIDLGGRGNPYGKLEHGPMIDPDGYSISLWPSASGS